MPGAFGFVKYPQSPSPNPQAIGQALMQMARQKGPIPADLQDADPTGEGDMDPDDPMNPMRRRPMAGGM